MFKNTQAFSGFAVDNLEKAKVFYGRSLGLECKEEGDMGLTLQLASGASIFIYPKEHHTPASYTILNFPVDDIDEAVEQLEKIGVVFERYNNSKMPQDSKGVFRGLSHDGSPDIAWFRDPAGNILSVLQLSKS